jgi:hypothetical protein
MRVYINGVPSGTLAYQGTFMKPPNDARIACMRRADSANPVEFVNGRIDELKLYNYALTPDTIAAHCIANSPAPVLIAYVPNPTSNRRPELRWYTNSHISTCRIEIDTSQSFLSPLASEPVTDTFYTPRTDLPYDTIYWRVCNDADTSVKSTVSSVRIVRPVPTLIAFTPNPTGDRRPQLRWYTNSYISTYRIEIDTSQSFAAPMISVAGTDTFYLPTADLPYDTVYWRVRNDADPLSWSTVSSVRIVRPVPTLIAYTPNPTGNSRPQLRWYRNSYISTYLIELDTNQSFAAPMISVAGTDTFYLPTSDLPYDTIYWRVRNEADTLSWSTVSSVIIIHSYPQGVVAHWSFDSSSGNIYYDVTGHGYDAIAAGTGLGLASGVAGQALSCPGSGYEIYAANSRNDFYLPRYSIECCFYSNGAITANTKILAFHYVQSGVRNGFGLTVNSTGNVVLNMSNSSGSAWVSASSSSTISPGRWYHLACTYDSADLRVYINGVLSGSLAYQGTFVKPPNDARIACMRRADSANPVEFVNGRIDELQLYNYALSADTIAAHSAIYVAVEPVAGTVSINTVLNVQARGSLLNITLPSAMVGKAVDIAVYSASGREIIRKKVQRGSDRFTVSAPNLALGAYVLSVHDGSRKSAVRFVIVR